MSALPAFLRSAPARVIGLLAAALAVYMAAAAAVAALTGDGLAASTGGAAAAVLFAVLWRRLRRRAADPFVLARPPVPARGAVQRAGMLVAMLATGFVGAQAASQWWYSRQGSESFDDVQDGLDRTPFGLVLLFVLVVAPIGEEALLRGTAYPAIRRLVPAWAAALVVSAGFALLHGNAVQAIATVPLGIVLAIAYEERNLLVVPIVAHVAFNAMSLLVPVGFVAAFMQPLAWGPVLLAFAALAAGEMRRQAVERRLSP